MRALEWTVPALRDLRTVEQWLVENASAEISTRTLQAILGRADFLRRFPQGGPRVTRQEFRSLRVMGTPYILLYRILDDRIQILRIRHEREDWHPA